VRDLENELTQLLASRAGHVDAPAMHDAIRRVRTRRAVTVGLAGVVVIAAVIGTTGLTSYLSDEEGRLFAPRRQIVSEGPYGFTSVQGDYPTIASGEFRGAQWELTGEKVTRRGIDQIHLELSIEKDGTTVTKEQEVLASDDVLMMRRVGASEMLEGAAAIFGATTPGITSVEAEVADGNGTSIPAHLFTDYDDRSTITAYYYVAFIPADAPGFVLARDELGTDLDRETYGRVSLAPRVIASGKQGRTLWSLLFAGMEDRMCLVFSTQEKGSECFSRSRVEGAGPLLMSVFEREGVRGVVAIISSDVGRVYLKIAGDARHELPWFQPPQDERRSWGLRIVAAGLAPETKGTLTARDGSGKVIAKKRF